MRPARVKNCSAPCWSTMCPDLCIDIVLASALAPVDWCLVNCPEGAPGTEMFCGAMNPMSARVICLKDPSCSIEGDAASRHEEAAGNSMPLLHDREMLSNMQVSCARSWKTNAATIVSSMGRIFLISANLTKFCWKVCFLQ